MTARHGRELERLPRRAQTRLRASAAAAFLRLPPHWQRSALHALGRFAPWEPEFNRHAPPSNGSLVAAAPDFVGVGVQKAGTSWWYELLVGHPDIYHHLPFHKERHFFSHFATRDLTDDEILEYYRWFPRPPGMLTGEWTPDYVHQPWTPAMLRRAAPHTKVLVLLRDPVERYRSGLDHHRQRGEHITAVIATDAFSRGLYGEQLQRLERSVPREQILVLLFEECRDEPQRHLARTVSFLGIPSGYAPESPSRSVGSTARVSSLSEYRRRELSELYQHDLALLAAMHPEVDLERWPSYRALAPRG